MTRKISQIKADIEKVDAPWLVLPDDLLDEAHCQEKALRLERLGALRQEKSDIVSRIAGKIAILRRAMLARGKGLVFDKARWAGRFDKVQASGLGAHDPAYRREDDWKASKFHLSGFSAGGWFNQPEDEREAFIEALLERYANGTHVHERNHG